MQMIPKNSRERIRVQLAEFRGVRFLDVRAWATGEDGEAKPTRQGVTVPLAAIPAFVEAVAHVGEEARPKAP